MCLNQISFYINMNISNTNIHLDLLPLMNEQFQNGKHLFTKCLPAPLCHLGSVKKAIQDRRTSVFPQFSQLLTFTWDQVLIKEQQIRQKECLRNKLTQSLPPSITHSATHFLYSLALFPLGKNNLVNLQKHPCCGSEVSPWLSELSLLVFLHR